MSAQAQSSLFRIPYDMLCDEVQSALESRGVIETIAQVEAQIMAEADLHGVPSHGVRMLPPMLRALAEGRAKANANIRITREFGAICVLDGDNGPGRYVATIAMQAAVDRSKQFGVGVCLATNTTHWGRAHAYALRAAQANCIGLCTTNAMQTMTAWGATTKIIGNNPLAIGIPRAAGENPMVLDMAMSQAAVAQGKPTNDAKAILSGAVSPMAGHKGAGLALMLEFMTAALGGGLFCRDLAIPSGGLETDTSKLFIALNIEAFSENGIAAFHAQVEDYLNYLRAEASTSEPFLYPGERGWQDCADNLRDGVPLHAEIVAQLLAAGVTLTC